MLRCFKWLWFEIKMAYYEAYVKSLYKALKNGEIDPKLAIDLSRKKIKKQLRTFEKMGDHGLIDLQLHWVNKWH